MLVVGVALAALVVGLGLRRTNTFAYGGYRIATFATVGQATLIGMGSSSRSVVVRHAEAVLSADSVPAVTSVFVCHDATHNLVLGTADGRDSLGQDCSKISPAAGAHLTADPPDPALAASIDYLVVSVVPLQPGRIVVDGVRVTHSGRWRDSTERSGPVVTIDVTAN